MDFAKILENLSLEGNLRSLPQVRYDGGYVLSGDRKMLNLSSNDYLGISSGRMWLREFYSELAGAADVPMSSTSSRLLTGNSEICRRLESVLAAMFGRESALVFSSGYHMNTGILPAVSDDRTLVLADKLVHASIIDGIRLSRAECVRFRHQDIAQLETLVDRNSGKYERIIIVVESIYSMDGDVTDLRTLAEIKKRYPEVMLYVDEAHAIGVRGETGLGVAEEQDCVGDIDFLCGTFGKGLSSVGAYLVCCREIRDVLVNRMRTLIFTTALPPVNLLWTLFILERIPGMKREREHLARISSVLRGGIVAAGLDCPSESHIVPVMVGDSRRAVELAEVLRGEGFYLLPVRPPTVPEGTSRLRISLTAAISENCAVELTDCITKML